MIFEKLGRTYCCKEPECTHFEARQQNFETATVSFVMSVRPSVRMEQLGSQKTDFHEILYVSIHRKSHEKIKVSLKLDKTNGYFT